MLLLLHSFISFPSCSFCLIHSIFLAALCTHTPHTHGNQWGCVQSVPKIAAFPNNVIFSPSGAPPHSLLYWNQQTFNRRSPSISLVWFDTPHTQEWSLSSMPPHASGCCSFHGKQNHPRALKRKMKEKRREYKEQNKQTSWARVCWVAPTAKKRRGKKGLNQQTICSIR